MREKTICSDLGYSCTMEDVLSCERVPIYRYEERPAVGSDARPGDTDYIAVGEPIGYEMEYTACRICSHCGKREFIGRKKVPIGNTLTFSDFLDEREKEMKFKKALDEFDRKQRIQREQFIQQNRP